MTAKEVGYVLEGELKLIVGGKSYTIAEGGSFFFRSDLPHSYGAGGRRGCRVIWIKHAADILDHVPIKCHRTAGLQARSCHRIDE